MTSTLVAFRFAPSGTCLRRARYETLFDGLAAMLTQAASRSLNPLGMTYGNIRRRPCFLAGSPSRPSRKRVSQDGSHPGSKLKKRPLYAWQTSNCVCISGDSRCWPTERAGLPSDRTSCFLFLFPPLYLSPRVFSSSLANARFGWRRRDVLMNPQAGKGYPNNRSVGVFAVSRNTTKKLAPRKRRGPSTFGGK